MYNVLYIYIYTEYPHYNPLALSTFRLSEWLPHGVAIGEADQLGQGNGPVGLSHAQ